MKDWDSSAFPEENASNYVNGRFDPQGAKAQREANRQRAAEQPWLRDGVRTIAQQHRPQRRDAR